MAQYKYAYLMEYLPTRFTATQEQINDRKEVYNFKDGHCSSRIVSALVKKVRSLTNYNTSEWCVCFIPASTEFKNRKRYETLAENIQRETGVKSSIYAITNISDREPGHIAGKKTNPAADFNFDYSYFQNKNVIIIDDVITRGTTYVSTADKLMANGALSVIGLFVAKTIHPN